MKTPLDRFFEHYYKRRPVNATFTGVHTLDDQLPDWSEAGLSTIDAELGALAGELEKFDGSSTADRIDAELAAGFCEIQRSENGLAHGPRGNPALWSGEAIFSVISLMIRDFAPLETRARSAEARMISIPDFLSEARHVIGERPLPSPWVKRALRDCTGADLLFSNGIERWLGDPSPSIRQAATRARDAFREFVEWIGALPVASAETMACGTKHYDLLLRRGHQCSRSRSELLTDAKRCLDEEVARLDEMCREARRTFAEAQRELADDQPTSDEYLAEFGKQWIACRKAIVDADVLSWPDWPIRYDEIPPFTRDAAPHLYYLFYRSPAPFDSYAEYTYVVSRGWSRSTIRLNHVLHHGGVGHHVQNWFAYHRAAARTGRIAAVDCANRIGMFCGGSMAEGWACYATGLMGEIGGLSALELISEQHSRIRQLARAVIDLSFHAGELSFDDAVALWVEKTGMSADIAQAEVVKCSMFPATPVMYWLGTQGILDLRREMRAREGSGFSLKRFHDSLLSYGSIPVPMIARLMRGDDALSS